MLNDEKLFIFFLTLVVVLYTYFRFCSSIYRGRRKKRREKVISEEIIIQTHELYNITGDSSRFKINNYLDKSFLDNIDYFMNPDDLEDAIIAFLTGRYDKSIGESLAFTLLTLVGHSLLCEKEDLLVRLILYVQINYGFSLKLEEMCQYKIAHCLNSSGVFNPIILVAGVDCLNDTEYKVLYENFITLLSRLRDKSSNLKEIHLIRYAEFLRNSRFAGNFGHTKEPYCNIEALTHFINKHKELFEKSYNERFDFTKFDRTVIYPSNSFCRRFYHDKKMKALKNLTTEVKRNEYAEISVDDINPFLVEYTRVRDSEKPLVDNYKKRGLNNYNIMRKGAMLNLLQKRDNQKLVFKKIQQYRDFESNRRKDYERVKARVYSLMHRIEELLFPDDFESEI